ncbi:MAG: hypothetical protein ACRD3W_18060 [Terriglobales bacterium]
MGFWLLIAANTMFLLAAYRIYAQANALKREEQDNCEFIPPFARGIDLDAHLRRLARGAQKRHACKRTPEIKWSAPENADPPHMLPTGMI